MADRRKPVLRSPMRRRVLVEQNYIDEAIRAHSGKCMIHDAIRDQVPGATRISVDLQTIRYSVVKSGLRYIYITPPVCVRNLVRWDRGEKISAFPFTLRGPHVTTMERDGKRVHKLGKRRFIPQTAPQKKKQYVPSQIGGKPVTTDKKHPSHSSRRIYGVRAYTLDDVMPMETDSEG